MPEIPTNLDDPSIKPLELCAVGILAGNAGNAAVRGWGLGIRDSPRIAQIMTNTTFRMFPDSSAAKGEKGAKPTVARGGCHVRNDAGHPFLSGAAFVPCA